MSSHQVLTYARARAIGRFPG